MSLPEDAAEVLDFWFNQLTPEEWFQPGDDLDETIARKFGGLHARLGRDGVPPSWRATPRGRLAAIIVLDQFPRNIYRGKAAAFSTDDAALELAMETVDGGHADGLEAVERKFVYLPFEHSEDPAVQNQSVRLFATLDDPRSLHFAEAHRDVIRRFGRFPHRNRMLGRVSTTDEEAYLAEPGAGFGWLPSDDPGERNDS